MVNVSNLGSESSARFMKAGCERIYRLFDAFLKKTVIEDRVIDFSKPAIENEDGSIEFAGTDQSFTELILGSQPFNWTERPSRNQGESYFKFKKRFQVYENDVAHDDDRFDDYTSDCNGYKAEVLDFLSMPDSDYPSIPSDPGECAKLPKKPKEMDSFNEVKMPKKKKTETEEQFQARYQKVLDKIKIREQKVAERMERYKQACAEKAENFDKRQKAYEDALAYFKEFKEKNSKKLLIAAHLHWLWTLGAEGVDTECGAYGEFLGLERQEYGNAGLWEMQVGKKSDLKLIYSVFERFHSWPNRPKFDNVDEVKAALVEFVLKVRKDSPAQIRNGLMHLCDPDKFINLYTFQEKVEYVKKHEDLLRGYHASDVAEMNRNDSVCYSQKNVTGDDFEGDYLGLRTEEKICYISDALKNK